jgi:hypothetical protein
MKTVKQTLVFFSILFSAHFAIAATDLTAQENFLKARVMNHQQEAEHANHLKPVDESKKFHGIFYGFLPCNNCNGIKATLSLKDNNNYLLVTQPAKESSREFYEKGKYTWDDENSLVLLTPRDNESNTRQYRIKDDGALIQLSDDGTQVTGEQADRYTLRRSDTVKSREVHIH